MDDINWSSLPVLENKHMTLAFKYPEGVIRAICPRIDMLMVI